MLSEGREFEYSGDFERVLIYSWSGKWRGGVWFLNRRFFLFLVCRDARGLCLVR